jgi:hypothetical protein
MAELGMLLTADSREDGITKQWADGSELQPGYVGAIVKSSSVAAKLESSAQ